MKLKQKIHHETDMPIPRCWVTDCGYTVAMCGIGESAMYIVSAPRTSSPFAYTKNKRDVRKIITDHKQANQ